MAAEPHKAQSTNIYTAPDVQFVAFEPAQEFTAEMSVGATLPDSGGRDAVIIW